MALGSIVAGAIGTQYIKTFEENVIHLAQQKASKLRNTVTNKPTGALSHSFRVTGARGAMTAKGSQGINGGKYQTTTMTNQVYNDRIAIPAGFYSADTYEWDDVPKMLADPESILVQSMAAQVGREIDKVIVAAFLATATDTQGTASLDFLTANTVTSAAGVFALADVISVNELMLLADIDPDEEKFLVVPPRAVSKLLNETKATSSDYVNLRTLQGNGTIKNFMGFTWIVSNLLNVPSANHRYCMAYTKDAIGLAITKEPFVDVAKDPSHQFATVVQVAMDLGAVRIQDAKCFRIDMADNA